MDHVVRQRPEKSVDHYKDGVQDGEHTGWYTDGKIAAIGMYKDGKQDGVWKRWIRRASRIGKRLTRTAPSCHEARIGS